MLFKLAEGINSIDVIGKTGMTVTRFKDVDRTAFIKSVQPIWDFLRAKYASLIDSIVNG
ncbi:MAG: hypothetical protein LBT33_01365 [Spirochaetia bacterium]|nr:hypothetical protein [Spirochaetia bacterium]